jgi:hypothetical protein
MNDLHLAPPGLLDPKGAAMIGQKVAASLVVMGEIVPRDASSTDARVRLIDADTGEVLLAARFPLDISSAQAAILASEVPSAPGEITKLGANLPPPIWKAPERSASHPTEFCCRTIPISVRNDPIS